MASHVQPSSTSPTPIVLAVEPFGGSARNHNPNLPLVFWDDAAVTRGDGVFETLLLRDGCACNVQRHIDRFCASARLLDLPQPALEAWEKATELAAEMWFSKTDRDASCVWTYTRGRESTGIPSAWLVVKDVGDKTVEQRESGVKVMTGARGYNISTSAHETDATINTPPWLVVGAKSLNYAANMAALRWAKSQGFDDVIFTDGEQVLEGATSTVVTVRGNKIRTPISGGDILPGTTVAALFAHATDSGWRCKEKNMLVDDLYRADSVWLLSSVRIATRVTQLDGKKLPKPANETEIRELIEAALGVP
ncbi:branched-chain amino acid aminotransferase/4-amino-4-deoxychorismate lyase [Corynebacterium mustelae]|uniref:Branched-chain amino acid aminotransferase/4-amino-4-deoxychorismate lyase n=1 Tax=Corynebacterium mustelae TaxID=571915 RepID=A0A0G3H0F2_9CORY|nr:aminodeoxychorismate lyase [Corynebacterium mustelae]AKK06881.1 branched-chain amino acid aminotransferase/4-amino-4-deoxychorismate lyase [Corynebacterium mustelae]